MTLSETMLNLCIGIVGGMFSGIIVSKIFLIQSSHSEQISRVQGHFEYLYELEGLVVYYLHILEKTNNGTHDLDEYLLEQIIEYS